MIAKGYLIGSGGIFFLVAILHLVRLIRHIPVRIGEWPFPLWVSFGGFVVPLVLSLVALRLLRSNGSK